MVEKRQEKSQLFYFLLVFLSVYVKLYLIMIFNFIPLTCQMIFDEADVLVLVPDHPLHPLFHVLLISKPRLNDVPRSGER